MSKEKLDFATTGNGKQPQIMDFLIEIMWVLFPVAQTTALGGGHMTKKCWERGADIAGEGGMVFSAASPASSFKGTHLILGSRVLESHFCDEK